MQLVKYGKNCLLYVERKLINWSVKCDLHLLFIGWRFSASSLDKESSVSFARWKLPNTDNCLLFKSLFGSRYTTTQRFLFKNQDVILRKNRRFQIRIQSNWIKYSKEFHFVVEENLSIGSLSLLKFPTACKSRFFDENKRKVTKWISNQTLGEDKLSTLEFSFTIKWNSFEYLNANLKSPILSKYDALIFEEKTLRCCVSRLEKTFEQETIVGVHRAKEAELSLSSELAENLQPMTNKGKSYLTFEW